MKTKFQTLICILLVGLFILAAGCGFHTTRLGNTDQGKQITIRDGGRVEIRLDANPSTGYVWDVAYLDNSLLKQTGASSFMIDNINMVGSGKQQLLTFEALKPGTTVLTLVYHKPWEIDVPPLKTYQVLVTIN